MIEIKLTLTGTRPLLMHNIRLADPLNEYAVRMKQLNASRKKTDATFKEIATAEFLGGLYYDEEIGPYVPGEWVLASLVNSGRMTRHGIRVTRGVLLGDFGYVNALQYPGPRDLESLEKDDNFRDRRMVAVQRNRVARVRPCFHNWSVEVPLYLDDNQLNFDEFVDVAERAGRFIGIGDHRPMFGRFDSEVIKVKEL